MNSWWRESVRRTNWSSVAERDADRLSELHQEISDLRAQLAIAEKRVNICERFAEPYTSATGSRWWELQLQGETFLEAVDAAGRDAP